MARLSDWIDLGKSTIRSIRTEDVAALYRRDWPETRKTLVADHSSAIDGERRRLRRWMRTVSAILYGLAKRLSPARRILFVLSFIWFFLCWWSLLTSNLGAPTILFFELAGAFILMVALLAMELIGKIKFRDELALARDLQATLIPPAPPRSDVWDIAAFNYIANTVGGDLYDFVPLADDRIAVLFGDASGHGMAAGLVMAVAHAAFRTQLDIDPCPDAVIGALNRILCGTGGSRSFFACCYVLLSNDGGFTATFAGHPQMLKVDAHGRVIDRLGVGAYPLGIKTGLTWETVSGRLERGERLVLHSDGLTEARSAEDREFGDAYVESVIARNGDTWSAPLVDALVAEWRKFTARTMPQDDVSIAVLARR